tara:strand:- start:116 stop:544 length:429 start_codon:yes stop_codon:yes gene_type:complete
MTQSEIVDETIAYYSKDVSRRSIIVSPNAELTTCMYQGPKPEQMCAVGRCLLPDLRKEMVKNPSFNQGGITRVVQTNNKDHDAILDDESFNKCLQEKYRGHSFEFWKALQGLHDTNKYWDEEGLTEEGTEEANKIRTEIFKS